MICVGLRSPLIILGCCGILAGCIYGTYLDHSSRVAAKKSEVKINPHRLRSMSPAPFTNFRKKKAIEWADACNPCGSEPDVGIHTSFGSLIQPPKVTEKERYSNYAWMITERGNCNTEIFPRNFCDFFICCSSLICKMTVFSPCMICSCIGCICGSIYGAGKDCQATEEYLADAPQAQQMT